MKILVACFILSTISFTSATPVSLQFRGHTKNQEDSLSTLLQALIGTQDQDINKEDAGMRDRDVAKLQGVFAVLEQVDREKANMIQNDGGMSTFWGRLGNALLDKGKSILKQKYCSENHVIKVLMQGLIGDRDIPEDDDDSDKDSEEGNVQAVAELKPLFKVLENLDVKATQYSTTDYSAKAEGWLNDIKKKIEEKIRAIVKKYLC